MLNRATPQVTAALTVIAAAIAVVIFLAFPLAYFAFGYRSTQATLRTQVEINGRTFSQIISANPELWVFEQSRLESLLARRPGDGTPERRRILGGDGRVVAEHADRLDTPWTSSSAPLYDSGRPVGELQITRSLRPLLLGTALAAALGALLATAVFVVLRALPLRALRRAMDALITEREHAFQMQRERDRADAETRLKSEFLARMSHEIRTPMNGVLGMTELLLSSPLNERQRKFAETAHRSGQGLLRIIDDILDFSKIEAGRLELESVSFSPLELAEDLVQAFAQRAVGKGLDIGVLASAEVPDRLVGDPGRIRQVLTNLIGNAVKFTERGEVCVVLAAGRAASADEPCILFEVRDSGIGISASALERLFAPFMQADGSISKRFGGTGLGLTISRQLARAMGGDLTVTSEEGRGSVFSLALPVRGAPSVGSAAIAGSPRVALVHGQSLGARSVHDALKRIGAKVDVFDDVARAVEALGAAGRSDSPCRLVLLGPDTPREQESQIRSRIESVCGQHRPRVVRLVPLTPASTLQERVQPETDTQPLPATSAELRALLLGCGDDIGVVGTAQRRADMMSSALRGRRVLLVEDNKVNQMVAVAMLESLGIGSEVVADGAQALDRLEHRSFDLVLMDCHMPGVDGYEATRRIRAREAAGGSRQIVIALTANALTEDRGRCVDAGMDDFLAKPFTRESLKAMMQRWMVPATA